MEIMPGDVPFFFWCVLNLVDRGHSESIQTVEQHIKNKDVIEWLVGRYGEQERLLFQKFTRQDNTALNEKIMELGSGLSTNPSGISNNGLCLLLDVAFRSASDKQ